jgi:FAD/FMN-containing dehydrogenase
VKGGKEGLDGILGSDKVSDALEALEAYSRDESFVTGFQPDLIVKPDNADEVQQLGKMGKSDQTQTPLVPVTFPPKTATS